MPVDRLPRVPVPVPGAYAGRNVNDVPGVRHYVSRPIVPNLASEFGKLDPPYVLPHHSSEPPKTADNTPTISDLANNYLQKTPSNRSPVSARPPKSSYFPTAVTSTTTPPSTFANFPTHPTTTTPIDIATSSSTDLSCRLPLTLPRLSSLPPPYEQMSLRITDPTLDDVKPLVPERLPSLESPSSTSAGSPDSPIGTCSSSARSVTGVAMGIDIPKGISEVSINGTTSPSTTDWNSGKRAEIPGVGVRTPPKWERVGKSAGIGVVGVGVGGVGIVGVDGMDMKPHSGGSGSDLEDLDSAGDSEIALHFKEFYKLAGDAEQRASQRRGYFFA